MILPTRARLAAAAALCALPLGASPGYRGVAAVTVAIERFSDVLTERAAMPPAKTLLVLAGLALVWCATRRRTPPTRRVAQAATLGIGLAAAFAASRGATVTFVCASLALLLAAPPAWRRRGVFVPGAADR